MKPRPEHIIIPLEESAYPWDLFLLADPSRDMIEGYISGAIVLGASQASLLVGAIILTHMFAYPARQETSPPGQDKGPRGTVHPTAPQRRLSFSPQE